MMPISQWLPFAKFCKNEIRLFSKRSAAQKKAWCDYDAFAITTVREISLNKISTFFSASRKTTKCEISRLQTRHSHRSRSILKIKFGSFLSKVKSFFRKYEV